MSVVFYKYRAKDGSRIVMFRVGAKCAESIPFENREKLDLKVTPEGHVVILRKKEMALEDVLIKIQTDISRLKEEMELIRLRAHGAVREYLNQMGHVITRDTDNAVWDVVRDLSKFEALGETIKRFKGKEDERVIKRAEAAHLTLKPFYLKWKKLAAEKEALEKEYEKRVTQL